MAPLMNSAAPGELKTISLGRERVEPRRWYRFRPPARNHFPLGDQLRRDCLKVAAPDEQTRTLSAKRHQAKYRVLEQESPIIPGCRLCSRCGIPSALYYHRFDSGQDDLLACLPTPKFVHRSYGLPFGGLPYIVIRGARDHRSRECSQSALWTIRAAGRGCRFRRSVKRFHGNRLPRRDNHSLTRLFRRQG